MTRATSINDNLITFDDSQVSKAEADIIVGQKSGPALAGQATTALKNNFMEGSGSATIKIRSPSQGPSTKF